MLQFAMDKILTQRYEETRECEAHLRQDPLLYPFGCCSFVPSVPFVPLLCVGLKLGLALLIDTE